MIILTHTHTYLSHSLTESSDVIGIELTCSTFLVYSLKINTMSKFFKWNWKRTKKPDRKPRDRSRRPRVSGRAARTCQVEPSARVRSHRLCVSSCVLFNSSHCFVQWQVQNKYLHFGIRYLPY